MISLVKWASGLSCGVLSVERGAIPSRDLSGLLRHLLIPTPGGALELAKLCISVSVSL
jgi:hypothetical protein